VTDIAAAELQESPIQLPLYFKGWTLGIGGSVELPALRAPTDQSCLQARCPSSRFFRDPHVSASPGQGRKDPSEAHLCAGRDVERISPILGVFS